MICTLAVANYRSLLNLVMPLQRLNVVTGANGSGKSNLYKALRLLAATANGGVISSLANEGGLDSAFWAGPEAISRAMKKREVPVEGCRPSGPLRLKLGFACEDFGYAITLGLPPPPGPDNPEPSKFSFDPEIKHECIWHGPYYRPTTALVDRNGPLVKIRDGRQWALYGQSLKKQDSILSEFADPTKAPEIVHIREKIKAWRFYDQFRTDSASQIRIPRIGTLTPVLDHDGLGLAAALQTIIEIGDRDGLARAIDHAFPGARLAIDVDDSVRFSIQFYQPGLLRPLNAAELSDGTLRYLLLVAALLTPRPPELMVLNEPENSLHPDLLPALARLIVEASEHCQLWIVSHSERLVRELQRIQDCNSIHLEKDLGQTLIQGQGMLDMPAWCWGE